MDAISWLLVIALFIALVILLHWMSTKDEAEMAAEAPSGSADPEPEPEPEPAPAVDPDDLTKIEGIGPKISELLADGGIPTFGALAAAPVERLREILDAAGSRYQVHDPASWPMQAGLAADGKWDELQELQDRMDGGRIE